MEQWYLRYKKVKLEICIEKRKREEDNIKFQYDFSEEKQKNTEYALDGGGEEIAG